MDLEKRPWSSKSSPAKGPKRLCKFCVLAVILPIICLCVPLYMRFQALKPQIFTLSPSDMKLLNQVSTNTNFYAFMKVDDKSLCMQNRVFTNIVICFRTVEYQLSGVKRKNYV